jgi:hypothetical protein
VQLQKYQKNDIFLEIVAGGLDPNECDLTEGVEEVRISHVTSRSYFTLEGDARKYTGSYVVGDTLPWPYEHFFWEKVREKVKWWAEEVKRDLDMPDLWAELRYKRGLLTGAGYEDVENTPFTSDEQTEIVDQVRQIKAFVKRTYSISEVQTLSIEAKLDEIASAAGRVGRKDWLLLFGGVILSVIMADLLPREAVWNILAMALHGLDHLFGGGGTPPQLPPIT